MDTTQYQPMPVSLDQFDQPGKALKCADCGATLLNTLECARCAAPHAPSVPQPAERNLPVVKRNWAATVLWAILCAASAAWAVDSVIEGAWFGAFGLLFLTIALLAFSVLSVSTTCPHCAAKLKQVAGIGQCPHCKGFYSVRDRLMHPIGEGFVAGVPAFSVPLNTLRPANAWQWPWRGRCAVCRAPATRQEKVRVVVPVALAKSVFAAGATAEFEIPVGHCAQHRNGVGFDRDANNAPLLKFRSWDHWRDFTQANRA
jgi:hypothetical protein